MNPSRRLEALLRRAAVRDRTKRIVRIALAAGSERPTRARPLPGPYFVRHGYVHRERPAYDAAGRTPGIVWQPDVYADAARVATEVGARRIIDLGSGDGRKLVELHPRFEIFGIDIGANLELSRHQFPFGIWIDHNLESDDPLPLTAAQLNESVIVCADVVEHLVRPEVLLRKVRAALDHARAAIISTPDRNLTWGPRHNGPPPNEGHVREWTTSEFAAFLASEGFEHGLLRLTRSNDLRPLRNTILVELWSSVRGDS